jgi:hypothetical protein
VPCPRPFLDQRAWFSRWRPAGSYRASASPLTAQPGNIERLQLGRHDAKKCLRINECRSRGGYIGVGGPRRIAYAPPTNSVIDTMTRGEDSLASPDTVQSHRMSVISRKRFSNSSRAASVASSRTLPSAFWSPAVDFMTCSISEIGVAISCSRHDTSDAVSVSR